MAPLEVSPKEMSLSNIQHDELDAAAFFLPAQGLYADWESAAGCVRLPDEFADASSFVQIKILGDWKREIAAQQAAALIALFRSSAPAAGSFSLDERIEQFRCICDQEGIECPDDLADLLRRGASGAGAEH
jgi:hypothetical protein